MKLVEIIEIIKNTFCIENFLIFLVQIISFLILCFAIFYLVYKPIKKKIKERNDYINNIVKETKQNKLTSERKLQEIEKKIINTYNEANDIIEDAKKKAFSEYDAIINKAKLDIEQERNLMEERMMAEIRNKKKEIVDVVLNICKELLERDIKIEDNQKYIDYFIENLSKNNNEKN